jgi:hypothetical protein
VHQNDLEKNNLNPQESVRPVTSCNQFEILNRYYLEAGRVATPSWKIPSFVDLNLNQYAGVPVGAGLRSGCLTPEEVLESFVLNPQDSTLQIGLQVSRTTHLKSDQI